MTMTIDNGKESLNNKMIPLLLKDKDVDDYINFAGRNKNMACQNASTEPFS
jgi:hypothetical protein